MAITLTSGGYQINSGSIITSPAAKVNTYACGEYHNREGIQTTSSGSVTVSYTHLTLPTTPYV